MFPPQKRILEILKIHGVKDYSFNPNPAGYSDINVQPPFVPHTEKSEDGKSLYLAIENYLCLEIGSGITFPNIHCWVDDKVLDKVFFFENFDTKPEKTNHSTLLM